VVNRKERLLLFRDCFPTLYAVHGVLLWSLSENIQPGVPSPNIPSPPLIFFHRLSCYFPRLVGLTDVQRVRRFILDFSRTPFVPFKGFLSIEFITF